MRTNLHTAATPWLQCYRRVPAPSVRLVCFPHAGGSASYFRQWSDNLPPGMELLAAQYPGREDRLREPVVTDLGVLADRYARILASAGDLPVVLFGHSLGAAIAYEVARRMQAEGGAPALLVVSGRHAPLDPSRAVHLMDDDALWADVARAGGTNPQVLESAELRAMVLPVLRADYRLSETYQPVEGPPLSCPVLAVSGDDDPDVDLTLLPGWGKLTDADFAVRVFDGNHFYLNAHRQALIGEIVRRLWHHTDGSAMP